LEYILPVHTMPVIRNFLTVEQKLPKYSDETVMVSPINPEKFLKTSNGCTRYRAFVFAVFGAA